MKFEELIKKIEEATSKIESGKVGLDESIILYEQAMKDCKECYDILNTAKGKIEILNKDFCENALPNDNKVQEASNEENSICDTSIPSEN